MYFNSINNLIKLNQNYQKINLIFDEIILKFKM